MQSCSLHPDYPFYLPGSRYNISEFPPLNSSQKDHRHKEGTEKVPSEIKGEKNSHKVPMNALRIAYLRQGVNYLSNIARKRAYTNTTVQALNLTVVFQCPRHKRAHCAAFLQAAGVQFFLG